jgi:hypothetical protein
MKPYGIRRSDVVACACCPGHDRRERKYASKLSLFSSRVHRSLLSNRNRDRGRKKHARQESKREIIMILMEEYD